MAQLPQVRRVMFNDEEIGMGFDSRSGLAVGTALGNFEVKPVEGGQVVTSSVLIVTSHEEVMETIGMSFEAEGRYGFFSASAKAQFSRSTNFNSTSTFLVARVIVQNPLLRGRGFTVQPAAQALLDALRFDEFDRAFGDSFVRGMQTGGEFYCVIRITSVSESKQSELSASLEAEANGLLASGSFKASFSEANKSSSTKSEYSAIMYQKAGSGSEIAPVTEISEVISRYKAFPTIAKASPGTYETELATYDTLPLPVPTQEEQDDFVLALADARDKKLRYLQLRNDLEFALKHEEFFEDLPDARQLGDAITACTRLVNAVIDHAVRLSRGEFGTPQLFDPSALSPPLAEPDPIVLSRVGDFAAIVYLREIICDRVHNDLPSEQVVLKVDGKPIATLQMSMNQTVKLEKRIRVKGAVDLVLETPFDADSYTITPTPENEILYGFGNTPIDGVPYNCYQVSCEVL